MKSRKNRTIGLLLCIMLVGVLLVCGVSVWRNESLSPAEVLTHSSQLHRRTIIVYGHVTHLQRKVSQRQHAYYTFMLSGDGKSLSVFSFGIPQIVNGQLVTVRGFYTDRKDVGPWSFSCELDATYGEIIPGKSTPERLRDRYLNWLPRPAIR